MREHPAHRVFLLDTLVARVQFGNSGEIQGGESACVNGPEISSRPLDPQHIYRPTRQGIVIPDLG